ncbi:MAG: acyl-CoA thioesterase [Marinovum sp.]|nr:acyl-CoA thioesterase [Marinovum sp.]
MHFSYPQSVLFRHCDPAGIVFYPRYFEMINDAVEAFFAGALDWPFEDIHNGNAVPTAKFDIRFKAPARHGDNLILNLTITQLGRSSLGLTTRALNGNRLIFEADQVLVCTSTLGKPISWPSPVRSKIQTLLETTL